jgi:hypothetical protein
MYLLANYTWSKMIDDASDAGGTESESNTPQNVYDYFFSERALSSFDHRHRLTASVVYPLPFTLGVGALRTLTEGWQLSGIFTAQTGAPFTVNIGSDNANVGVGPAQRPDYLRNPNLESGRTPLRWFDTGAFAMPAPFTFGNARRNQVFAPGEVQLDAALQKEFAIRGEAVRLQFRTEAFNLLNRPNFNLPNRIFVPDPNPAPGQPVGPDPDSPFGRITSARDARQLQFGLKLLF